MSIFEKIRQLFNHPVDDDQSRDNSKPDPSEQRRTEQLKQLAECLSSQELKSADIMTAKILCDCEKWTEADPDIFFQLPLNEIDELWAKASNGRFGFRAQLELGDSQATILEAAEIPYWYSHVHDDVSYSQDAPIGHLPMAWFFCDQLGLGDGYDRVRRDGVDLLDALRSALGLTPNN